MLNISNMSNYLDLILILLLIFFIYMSIKLTDLPNNWDTFFEKDEIYLFLIRQKKKLIYRRYLLFRIRKYIQIKSYTKV